MSLAVADIPTADPRPIDDGERAMLERAGRWLEGHRAEFEDTLARWVAVPSVCDESHPIDGRPLGEAVARMFDIAAEDIEAMGLCVQRHEGYAISAAIEGGASRPDLPVGGPEEIALVGHLDVVPAGDGWTREPFRLTAAGDGIVFGRGVADCKGPSLTDLWVLRMVCDLEVPMRHRLRVLLGGGEETSMNDLRGYLERHDAPGFSLVTDGPFPVNYGQKGILQLTLSLPAAGIWADWSAGSAGNAVPGQADIDIDGISIDDVRHAVEAAGEPYRGRLLCAPAGDGRIRLDARGEAGHAAFQDGTLSAIMLLAGFLHEYRLLAMQGRQDEQATADALYAIARATDGEGLGLACADESGALSFNLGAVRPSAAIPGRLELICDSRYPVSFDGGELVARLKAALAAFPAAWDAHLDEVRDEPAYRIDPAGVESRTLAAAFDAYFGVRKPPFTMGGGTHSRLLPRSVTFGADFWYMDDVAAIAGHPAKPAGMDADHGGAHAADECVNIDNLMVAAKLYLLALVRLDAQLGAADTSQRSN